MNIKEELTNQIKTQIIELERQVNFEENEKLQDLKSKVEKLHKKIISLKQTEEVNRRRLSKDMLLNKIDINSLDLQIILELFSNFSQDYVDELKKYQKLFGSIFFNPNKDIVLNNLKPVLDDLFEKITQREDVINNINKEISKLKELVTILENDYENIFNTNINKIIEFLKQQGKTEIEILEYIRKLVIDIEQNILQNKENEHQQPIEIEEQQEEEIEILEENSESIENVKDKIVKLLNDNGYNNITSYFENTQTPKIEKIKEDLFRYGKLEKIENIIETFKNYNIDLLEEINQGNFFKIITLLLYSSKENIETIFNLALDPDICICKYDKQGNLLLDEQGKPKINFNLLLERISKFINRKRIYQRKGNTPIEINIDNKEVGNMEDFLKNIRFFQKLGVDIKQLFKKFEEQNKTEKSRQRQRIGSYFDEPHDKILRNKNIFDFYEIPQESYLSTLSCFMETTPADTMDMCIELDILDYLKKNMSRMTLKPDAPIFYRIARTYQLAEQLPNPQNLPLHQNAKQFLFIKWHGDNDGKYVYGKLDGYIANPEVVTKRGDKLKLDTQINKTNGSLITKRYKREEVLIEDQIYNFTYFDSLVNSNKNNNDTVELINENSPLIRTININAKSGLESRSVLEFGVEPNKIRISKRKFYRIYNTLCQNGMNIENDRDCVLYALTYNSILTVEQFEVIKAFVNNVFKNIPQKSGRVVK